MQNTQRQKLTQMTKRSRYRSFWRKFVRVMACIVVFCTTYALILPAITMDQEWYCGFQAHVHTEECWTETTLVEFSCQPVEGAIHSCQEACPWNSSRPGTAPRRIDPHLLMPAPLAPLPPSPRFTPPPSPAA